MSKVGKVHLVGAGCGDFDLITLRGLNLLEQCDTVVYDSLIDKRYLDFADKNAEKISVGKRAGKHSETQDNINNLLVEKAMAGKNVVRLKGGDPFVFGRGGEEILELEKHKIPYSVTPGISSSIAVPELAGIPVTHRKISRSFHVITGHTADDLRVENFKNYANLDGTLIFLMGLGNIEIISKNLIKSGKSENTPTAVISKGGTVNQRVLRSDLKNISHVVLEQGIEAPAIIVVGETAKFNFSSTVNLDLQGVSVAVTGTKQLVNKFTQKLESLGSYVLKMAYLDVLEYEDNKNFENSMLNINNYNWVVLTSSNGAEIFFKKLRKLKIDVRNLSDIKFAVIGTGTASVLEKYGVFADLMPKVYTAQALGECLVKTVSEKDRLLILRAEKGSVYLNRILDNSKISYDDVKTYDVIYNNNLSDIQIVETDFVTFASSSGVHAFFENGYEISDKTKVVSIGDITAKTLRKYGVEDFYISNSCTVDGIINVITEAKNEKI